MSRRGQGGKRAKGRRGDQDPELENTAWLAELEREAAARADDEDEEEWASTLRGRRTHGAAADPGAPSPPPQPSWASDPGPPPPADPSLGPGPDGAAAAYGSDAWPADPDPPTPAPGPAPDWSWRPPAPDTFGEPRSDVEPGTDSGAAEQDPAAGDWRSAGVGTPTGAWEPVEPVGREPDYPALFGELYRRSAGQQDPIWEAPPATEPLPEQGSPDPQPASWPFEETTQSWEPSDRSFIWPADELPSASSEWNTPPPPSWLDDPGPQPPADTSAHATAPSPSEPDPDQTAAWSVPWADQPGSGGGEPPAPTGPPSADWAAAIPTDVPAASRAADPASTRVRRPDEAVEPEPGVPLGPGPRSPADQGAASRTAGPRGPAGEGPTPPAADPMAAAPDPVSRAFGTRAAGQAVPVPDTEPDGAPRRGPWNRPAGERQARTWPRIVAVISWIVLVMVVCWFYVFPWLERVLPENF